MLTTLVFVLVVLVVAYGLFYLIDNIGMPHPMPMLSKAIVAIIALVVILQHLGVLNGNLT